MKRIILAAMACAMLTGCSESRVFGVKESVWNELSPQEREIVIKEHAEQERRQAEIEAEESKREFPIKAAIDIYETVKR